MMGAPGHRKEDLWTISTISAIMFSRWKPRMLIEQPRIIQRRARSYIEGPLLIVLYFNLNLIKTEWCQHKKSRRKEEDSPFNLPKTFLLGIIDVISNRRPRIRNINNSKFKIMIREAANGRERAFRVPGVAI